MSWLETYGFVYVVSDGTAYKIGETSGCVYDRIKNLQSGNPRPIEFIHCYETADRKGTEKYLHEQLSYFRTTGEWFKCSLEEIDDAAEELESLFGAVKCEPFKLERTKGTFTREVIDYWFMGETLTLQLAWSEGDHRDLNFTTSSRCSRSHAAGQALLKDLRTLLRVHSHDAMHRKLMELSSRWNRPAWMLTYSRKRSLWLNLNDFELHSIRYEEKKVLA